jgi:dienelactone hydrolase
VIIAIGAIANPAYSEIKTADVIFTAGQVESHSFLAYDEHALGRRPGVLVVPEWWGLNDYTRTRARMLARLGYTALAVDIYGGGKLTRDPAQAKAWATQLETGDRSELRRRIAAALARLKSDPRADPARTAAIGYCFGGTTVLELARSGADLESVVSFHGHLATSAPAQAGAVKARILVCVGADDPFVPPDQVEAFEREMKAAAAHWEVNVYSGAQHAFTNPGANQYRVPGLAYNRDADQSSWDAMQDFFKQTLK